MVIPEDFAANKVDWLCIPEVVTGEIFMSQPVLELCPCRQTSHTSYLLWFFSSCLQPRSSGGLPLSNVVFINLDGIHRLLSPVEIKAKSPPQYNIFTALHSVATIYVESYLVHQPLLKPSVFHQLSH